HRLADAPDRPVVGGVLHRALDRAAVDDVLVLHDPAPGRAARQRRARPADQHADLPGQPADPARGLPAGHGLASAAPHVPDGAPLPTQGTARAPDGNRRLPPAGGRRGRVLLPPYASAGVSDGCRADVAAEAELINDRNSSASLPTESTSSSPR